MKWISVVAVVASVLCVQGKQVHKIKTSNIADKNLRLVEKILDVMGEKEHQSSKRACPRISSSIQGGDPQKYEDRHNYHRRNAGASDMRKLTYSSELAGLAQEWANQCLWDHGGDVDCNGRDLGQNMFMSSMKPTPEYVVNSWHQEEEAYNYYTKACNPPPNAFYSSCGHYTQVVWASTSEVGCGYKNCPGQGHMVVCNYREAGNLNYPWVSPFKKGSPCSQCPSGTSCSNSLCASGGGGGGSPSGGGGWGGGGGSTGGASGPSHGYVPSGELSVDNGYYAGSWRNKHKCPHGSYAGGIQIKNEGATGDDTSVNAVEINCFDVNTRQEVAERASGVGEWGSWQSDRDCDPGHYVVAFQLLVEPSQGGGDDTGVNGIRVKCRGPGLTGSSYETIEEKGTYWSTSRWGSWSQECPSGTAVCAIQTKLESDQGWWGDDAAIADVKLFCCYAP